jgi:TonB family protein
MIVMGARLENLAPYFSSIQPVGQVYYPYAMPYEQFTVYYCRGIKMPLKDLWPKIKNWNLTLAYNVRDNAGDTAMSYSWKQWEGQIVDGKFPLHQYLGASDHDAVFLTERPGQSPARAAIKVIPVEFVDADRQLASWEKAAHLSHRHLLRIFEHGRAQIDGVDVLYALMEYAEEDLSQILPERPLTPDECTDMMQPVVDALAYIHAQGLVDGHVTPSNIMASGNEVKISSETIQLPGPPLVKAGPESAVYDAPEVPTTGLSVASDVWSLGATALEAVTQRPPATDAPGDPAIPQLPEPLFSIIHNCLRIDPQQRWSLAQISNSLRPAAATTKPSPAPQPHTSSKPVATRAPSSVPSVPSSPRSNRSLFPLIAIAVVLAALIGYFVTRKPRTDVSTSQPATADAPSAASAAPASSSIPTSPPTTASGQGQVIHRGTAEVPAAARNTIRGTVRVNVRVSVDRAGNVTATALENHGPSRYFADLARKSASNWKFAPPQVDGKSSPSKWVLKYEFRRGGTTVLPVQETP